MGVVSGELQTYHSPNNTVIADHSVPQYTVEERSPEG